jgi:serine/threonine-protein kinase
VSKKASKHVVEDRVIRAMNGIGSASHLQAALGGQYTVERELGGGGMSHTYVARDTALDRRVVIKVLPPDLAATVSHDRFRREILVSASLQHPNIVGILTAGEVDRLPYFTMPFVDGESLRARIQRNGPLSVAHAVSILRDVARALAYAHERGIVHRDIKPDNVLLTAGAAVVADFGVSKALASARVRRHHSGEHDATITTAGTALGTPAYMAPEQAAGDPHSDHRADLYAFGVMAYEMLLGQAPFADRSPAQLLAAHISEQPRHVATARNDIPRALADLVMRCLEKEPTRRPQSATDVAVSLEDPAMVSGAFASAPALPVPAKRRPAALLVGIGALAAAAVLVVGFLATQAGGDRNAATTVPTVPLALADARALAVLPLVSLSADSADAYLADGITDELISALSRIGGFRVASRTAAQAAREGGAAPRDIAAKLNVANLLEGTVQRQGTRVRVAIRLVNATDGFTVWSDVFDEENKDLFALQEAVASAVADALTEELGPTPVAAVPAAKPAAAAAVASGTADPVAYDHYLRGRALFQRRDAATLRQALTEFESAVKRDNDFARAHAGIASVFAVLPIYTGSDPAATVERGLSAANTAVRLDAASAEGFAARGALQMSRWQFDDAHSDLRRALEIDPENPLALQWMGELHLMRGNDRGAEDALARASLLDPATPVIGSVRAIAHRATGTVDSALAIARRSVDFDPSLVGPRLIYGTLLLDDGRLREALKELEAARTLQPNVPITLGTLGAAYAKAGDRVQAEEIVARLESMAQSPRAPSSIAKIKLALGDNDGALTWLRRAADARDPAFTSEPLTLRMWDPVRADPRFAEIVRRVGLGQQVIVRPPPATPPRGGPASDSLRRGPNAGGLPPRAGSPPPPPAA